MTRYVIEMESLWRDQWLPIGLPVTVESDSAPAALSLVDHNSIGFRPGVMRRLHIMGPNVDVRTDPAPAPEPLTLPR